jgi:hypothetical protein
MHKSEIDLASIVEASGVELRRCGNHLSGVCPFHADKDPSMHVYQDGHFHCFGCGARGDVIDYVRKKHGLSYPEALRQLGLSDEKPDPAVARQIERQKALLKQFERWQVRYSNKVGGLLRMCGRAIDLMTPEDFDDRGDFYGWMETYKYHLDILAFGSQEERFQLYREVKHGRSVRVEKAA